MPRERLGIFLVHTSSADRTLRRRFVESILGATPPPPAVAPGIESGTYRPILLPRMRIEHAANIATDAAVDARGNATDRQGSGVGGQGSGPPP